MTRINATVRDEHIEQLKEVKKAAEGEISDVETTRQIFDRAASVQAIEQDLRNCEQRVSELRADRDKAVAQARQKVRNELEAELDGLERENERFRREKRQILEQREENHELQRYVEDELSYREAGLGTRVKWWLFGKKRRLVFSDQFGGRARVGRVIVPIQFRLLEDPPDSRSGDAGEACAVDRCSRPSRFT